MQSRASGSRPLPDQRIPVYLTFSSLVFQHPAEVCPVSRGVILSYDPTPIRSITERPSLPPLSPTCTPLGSPCGSLSLEILQGEIQAYHVPRKYPGGVGLASPPVGLHLRQGS
jgi:hypothetical protein